MLIHGSEVLSVHTQDKRRTRVAEMKFMRMAGCTG